MTARGRFTRALKAVHEGRKANPHRLLGEQHQHHARVIRGDRAYNGRRGAANVLAGSGIGHSPLAEGAREQQPRGSCDLGSHDSASERLPSTASHGRALDLCRLSGPGT